MVCAPILFAGCAPTDGGETDMPFAPEYLGIETRLLDSDIVQFDLTMTGARDGNDIKAYADCAAAQYTLIRGYGFARHLRTNIDERGSKWRADAVYTISPSRPQGLSTIDAVDKVAECTQNGIPTV